MFVWSVLKAGLRHYSLKHEQMSRDVLAVVQKLILTKGTTLLIDQLINGCSSVGSLEVKTILLVIKFADFWLGHPSKSARLCQ